MSRLRLWYVKTLVVSMLIGGSLSTLGIGAWAEEPCTEACRFLGFDDELALSMHNNSSQDDENHLNTYVGEPTELWDTTVTNPMTEKDMGRRVVSSVTVTGKMTVDPAESVTDEIFTVSIVEVHRDGEPDSSRIVVNSLYNDSQTNLLNWPFDDNDNTESRIGAATGNLTGDLRDEIAIAYENARGILEVLVLRNEDMRTHIEARAPMSIKGGTALKQGRGIVVTSGNFDGDEYDEFAVLYEIKAGVELKVYKVQADAISPLASTTIPHEADCTRYCRRIGVTAGDFDGDGLDELITATIDGTTLKSSYFEVQGSELILKDRTAIFEPDEDHVEAARRQGYYAWQCPDLRLISADFEADGRTVGAISYRKSIHYIPYEWGGDEHFRYGIALLWIDPETQALLTTAEPERIEVEEEYALTVDIAALSTVDHDTPGDRIICAALADRPVYSGDDNYLVKVLDVDKNVELSSEQFHYHTRFEWGEPSHDPEQADQIHPSWSFSIAAGEFDGAGQTLDAPEELVFEETYQPVLILQTPPQHIDVFDEGVTNLSYFVEFNSQFDYEEGTSQLAANRSTAEYGNGLYSSAEVKGTYGPFSFGVNTKTDAMWKNAIEAQNSRYQETALTSQLRTTVDDLVRYNEKTVRYWRYPAPMGADNESLQFAIPDADSAHSYTANGSGLDYYQPEHENGNLLSYPWFPSLPDDDVEVLHQGQIIEIGEGDLDESLALSSRQASSAAETSGHTWQLSAGVSAGFSIGLVAGSAEAGYQHDQAVQQSSTSETTTYGLERISIHKVGEAAELLSEQSYAIQPLFFRKEGGPIQVSYTVNPNSLGAWWYNNYRSAPDPALNLPDRWKRTSLAPGVAGEQLVGTYSYVPNTGLSRHRMKSFFVFDKPLSDENAQQGWGAEVNTELYLRARIYNYSMKRAPDVRVQFQYQVYDGNEWSTRKNIGNAVSVGNIPAWGNPANQINWTWAEISFTPTAPGYYCFWVIVDPTDELQELSLHDNRDRYSNNVGYWGVPFPVAASGDKPSLPPDNIVPEFGDFARRVRVFEQGQTSLQITASDASRAEGEELQYRLIKPDNVTWIDLDKDQQVLRIDPARDFIAAVNAGETEVTIEVSNAVTQAQETVTIEVLSLGDQSRPTRIEHYGARPAAYHLGMQGWTCEMSTQQLTPEGLEEEGEPTPQPNTGWVTLQQDQQSGPWELALNPGKGEAFWHRASESGTQYAKQRLIVACTEDSSTNTAARKFEVTIANNLPTLTFSPASPESHGMAPFEVRISGEDDTGDPLTYSIGDLDREDQEWITFDADSQTLLIVPAKAPKASWQGGEGDKPEFTKDIVIHVSDGAATVTKTLTMTINNNAPYCNLDEFYKKLREEEEDKVTVQEVSPGHFRINSAQGTYEAKHMDTITLEDGGILNNVIDIQHKGSAFWMFPLPLILDTAQEEIEYEFYGLADWIAFDASAEAFSVWPARADWHGGTAIEALITLKITDHGVEITSGAAQTRYSEQIFRVRLTNTPPAFQSPADVGAPRNQEFVYHLTATDGEADPLAFSVSELPAWLDYVAGRYSRISAQGFELIQEIHDLEQQLVNKQQTFFNTPSIEPSIRLFKSRRDELFDQINANDQAIKALNAQIAGLAETKTWDKVISFPLKRTSTTLPKRKSTTPLVRVTPTPTPMPQPRKKPEPTPTPDPLLTLNAPRDVALGPQGATYITDTGNSRILHFLRLTKFNLDRVAWAVPIDSLDVSFPCGVAVDTDGTLYIADAGRGKHGILTYKLGRTPRLQQIAGAGKRGYSGDGGPATRARLNRPQGVAVDSAGNVYIADTWNHRIRKLTLNSDGSYTITTIAGNGERGYHGDGKPATQARLSYPRAVAVDSAGNVYIADTWNNRIRKITTDGVIWTIAGPRQISRPFGVDVDSNGNVYIADRGHKRICKVTPDGNLTTVFKGENRPYGIAFNEFERAIYIAERDNNLVRKSPLPGKGILEQQKAELEQEKPELEDLALVYGSWEPMYAEWHEKREALQNDDIWEPAEGSPLLTEREFTEHLNDNLPPELVSTYGDRLREKARATSRSYLRGTPGPGDGGEHTITLSVSDGIAATTQALTITVPNQAPEFTSQPVETAALDQAYMYHITTEDADGDPLQCRVTQAPSWLRFSQQRYYRLTSAVIQQLGRELGVSIVMTNEMTILFMRKPPGVPDPERNVILSLFKIKHADDAPLRTEEEFLSELQAALDNNLLKAYQGRILAAAKMLDEEIAGTPTVTGHYPVVLTVDDGAEEVEQRYVITVGPASGNTPPAFTTTPVETAVQSLPYTYAVQAADADEDPLFYWSEGLPEWLSLQQPETAVSEISLTFGPRGIVADAVGNLYVAASDGIRRISAESGQVEEFASTCGDDNTNFSSPQGIAIAPDGSLYVADRYNDRICRISSDGTTCNELDLNGLELSDPCDVAVEDNSIVYVADLRNNRVIARAPDGSVRVVGDSAHWIPTGLTVDRQGNLYVADNAEGAIWRLEPDDTLTLLAGTGVNGYSGDSGPASAAQLNYPFGLAIDHTGNLYIADMSNDRIRKIALDLTAFDLTPDSLISTIVGADEGELYLPYDVAVDQKGTIYVADTYHKRILQLDSGSGATLSGTPPTSDDSSLDYPVTVKVSDWKNPVVTQTFTITVGKGKWVTFKKGGTCAGEVSFEVEFQNHPEECHPSPSEDDVRRFCDWVANGDNKCGQDCTVLEVPFCQGHILTLYYQTPDVCEFAGYRNQYGEPVANLNAEVHPGNTITILFEPKEPNH